MSNFYLIGLVGNLGSGKSTVRKMLEHLGAHGLDADALAHVVMQRASPTWRAIVGTFGLGVLQFNGRIDRRKLAAKVFDDLLKQIKESLGETVKEVRVTHRLTNSPACLVTGEHEMSANLERILKSVGQQAPTVKPTLEINPEHPLVLRLKGESGQRFDDLSHILFDQALLAEGGQLDDPASFVQRLNQLLLEMSN